MTAWSQRFCRKGFLVSFTKHRLLWMNTELNNHQHLQKPKCHVSVKNQVFFCHWQIWSLWQHDAEIVLYICRSENVGVKAVIGWTSPKKKREVMTAWKVVTSDWPLWGPLKIVLADVQCWYNCGKTTARNSTCKWRKKICLFIPLDTLQVTTDHWTNAVFGILKNRLDWSMTEVA